MTLYNCVQCKYTTKKIKNYDRHLFTLKHLTNSATILFFENAPEMTTNDHSENPNDHKMTTNDHNLQLLFECQYCHSSFSTKPHMRRHQIHYCDEAFHQCKDIALKRLKKKNTELVQLNNSDSNRSNRVITTNIDNSITNTDNSSSNSNNITHNITNNIQLTNFGEENIEHITTKVLDRLMRGPGKMIQKLFKLTHYSRKHPENKNIKITNRKDKYIHIQKDGSWIYGIKKHILDAIIDKHYGTLEAHYEENKDKKMDYIHQGRFDRYAKRIEEADKETLAKIIEDITLMILNHSSK